MNLNPELVQAGRRLRDRLAELGAEVERVQADLRTHVGRMGAAGGSPAEIAAAIGLGEQQVRELLPAPPGGPPAVAGSAAAPGMPAAHANGAAEAGAEARAGEPAAAGAGEAAAGGTEAFAAAARAVAEELDDAEEVELGGPTREAALGWATLSCAFCGAPQGEAGRLIAGPGVAICDGCARLALDLLVEGEGEGKRGLSLVGGEPRDRSRCSFCGKRSRRVGRLVAGSGGVNICGECLDLCTEILSEDLGR